MPNINETGIPGKGTPSSKLLTLSNRKTIRDSLKAWSQRRNIADEIWNDFIELALTKANRALRIPPFEQVVSLPLNSFGYFDIPDDFQEVIQVSVMDGGKRRILERKDISEVDDVFQQGTGTPQYFGRALSRFRIAPYNGAEEAYLYYYKVIPVMPDDTTENWYTRHAPELLLYGGLAELAAYSRDDEGEQRWNNKFSEAINIIQGVEDRAAWWSGDPVSISMNGSTR